MESIANEPETRLDFTGERLMKGLPGDMAFEHLHRYALARRLAAGKRILDVASGDGYGSNLLAEVADSVIGVDIALGAVRHASATYRRDNLTFIQGDCTDLPLDDTSVDLVVSFETIEHVADHEGAVAEFARVLRPDGILIISTPDKRFYSDVPDYDNPFHMREMYPEEFRGLLGQRFERIDFYDQRMFHGSAIAPSAGSPPAADSEVTTFTGDYDAVEANVGLPNAVYLLAVASNRHDIPRFPVNFFESSALPTELQLQLETKITELALLDAELRRREAAIRQREEELRQLRRSISWRCTAPFRRATVLLRQGFSQGFSSSGR